MMYTDMPWPVGDEENKKKAYLIGLVNNFTSCDDSYNNSHDKYWKTEHCYDIWNKRRFHQFIVLYINYIKLSRKFEK